MMNEPLTLKRLLWRTERLFPKKEVVSRTSTGDLHRYTYREFGKRVAMLANALDDLGVEMGDRIGTYAWNTHRHLELYFGAPCSGGSILTVNIRLREDYIKHIINESNIRLLFISPDLVSDIESIQDEIDVEAYVVLGDDPQMETSLEPIYCYESLLEGQPQEYEWPELEEDMECGMCYSSGTTGKPKGVTYTHRGVVLHALNISLPDSLAFKESDTVYPVVPMYHVNAWGFPHAAVMTGATLVLPGPKPSLEDHLRIITEEEVTFSGGAVTIWVNVLERLREGAPYTLDSVRGLLPGGQAVPKSMIRAYEEEFGVDRVYQAWGMTEATPLVAITGVKSYLQDRSNETEYDYKAKQGLILPGMKFSVVDDLGAEVPWDGETLGEIRLRGPWVADGYYKDEERSTETFQDGWFYTGDIVCIDEEGYIELVDREKDLVKSGGEWISSVEIENNLIGHKNVESATVIAADHQKWQERPLAIVVRSNSDVSPGELEEFLLETDLPEWWIPDDFVFVDAIPETATGKYNKKQLRDSYRDYFLA